MSGGRVAGVAPSLAMLALAFANPALAQRAASGPSLEEAGGPAPAPPPPPGFPTALSEAFVFGGEVETHLQGDVVAAHGAKTRVSVFDDTSLSGFLNYRTWLSVNAEARLERNRDDTLNSYYVDRNAFMRSEGLTLRQLYVTLRPVEGLSFYGGKIHPGFGSAYEQAPGQFYNFGTDYEQDERIGFGVEVQAPLGGPEVLGLSSVRIAAETFYLDTTSLSRSLLSAPSINDPTADRYRRFTRGQYGPSNTGSFDSATFSVRGGRPSRGLAWQASATREATAEPGGRTEFGQSVGASYDPTGDGIPLGPRLGAAPYFEYAHFTNFQGMAGLERHYAVGGLAFTYARWALALAAGLRRSEGAATASDHQENVTLTYQVLPRLYAGAGFNVIEIDGRKSYAVSPALNYKRAF
jgi:hypothetical protein